MDKARERPGREEGRSPRKEAPAEEASTSSRRGLLGAAALVLSMIAAAALGAGAALLGAPPRRPDSAQRVGESDRAVHPERAGEAAKGLDLARMRPAGRPRGFLVPPGGAAPPAAPPGMMAIAAPPGGGPGPVRPAAAADLVPPARVEPALPAAAAPAVPAPAEAPGGPVGAAPAPARPGIDRPEARIKEMDGGADE